MGYKCGLWTSDQGCPLHGEACEAARDAGLIANVQTATTEMRTYRISQNNFAKGLAYAKKFHGQYNAADKTWTIPTHNKGVENTCLNAPGMYGLVAVAR